MIDDRDLCAAIQQSFLTEAQAAGLFAFAYAPRQTRDRLVTRKKPFVRFNGFNDIFILINLLIRLCGLALLILGLGLVLLGAQRDKLCTFLMRSLPRLSRQEPPFPHGSMT